jgi:hypothetical protein
VAELRPLFVLPLARIERVREAARVDGALVNVEVVCNVRGPKRLFGIADTRVCRLATTVVWESTLEGTREGWVDGGRFPDEKNPAIMFPAVVCVRMRDGSTNFLCGGEKGPKGRSRRMLATL